MVVENIVRHFHLPQNKGRNWSAIAVEAVGEVGNPTILATFAVIAAVLPMAFVGGLMGLYMRPIPIGASAEVYGPAAGIETVAAIKNQQALDSYYLLYAVLAEFEAQLEDFQSAADHLRKAIGLTEIKSEQSLLSKRLKDCAEQLRACAGAGR